MNNELTDETRRERLARRAFDHFKCHVSESGRLSTHCMFYAPENYSPKRVREYARRWGMTVVEAQHWIDRGGEYWLVRFLRQTCCQRN